jgi:hypothetical protein
MVRSRTPPHLRVTDTADDHRGHIYVERTENGLVRPALDPALLAADPTLLSLANDASMR